MAAINEYIQQISDPALRQKIQNEVDKLTKQKKFGLVFEEHLPERTPLYELPIKKGSLVALKAGEISKVYTVISVDDGKAACLNRDEGVSEAFELEDLVCVAEFGEPIYPYLKPIDSVCNAPDSSLCHTLIQADNYHALQLLQYLYAGKVDCIYIDPPYNTGARDWKYNNDYVDGSDAYRHSKWLSFMEKRLKIAKKLLNPKDSVLIVTIDEKEYLHLGCLLEEIFPDARMQMISTVINPANVARSGEFGRSGEYIFYVFLGSSAPQRVKIDREWVSSKGRTHTGNIRWDLLKRSGTNAERVDRPNLFYPIYINSRNGKIEKIGAPLPLGQSKAPDIDGLYTLLPIRQNGSEGNWQWSGETLQEGITQGRVKVGGDKNRGFTIYRLAKAEYKKVLDGEFVITGHGINNEIIVDDIDMNQVMAVPGDIWRIASHDSTQYGSRLIGNIFGGKRFTFPKSLYAVKDCVYFVTANKPNALIIDFFAGSGTTLHAVNLLNAEDGGHRRCIMVTNNEVSEEEAKYLAAQGYKPGDDEWEKLGIAQYVTWPRTVCSIEGHDMNGNPLKGNYIGSNIPMADGFKANAAFFKLGFLDKTAVALGRQFRELLPLLWLKAGSAGKCPEIAGEDIPSMLILPENQFAVLVEEASFTAFERAVDDHPEIQTVYLVTDYDVNYRAMANNLKVANKYQLYRDYLDNFRINQGRN